MARRGAGVIADLAEVFLRIAAAIAFETAALVVWNIGTRPPHILFDDIRRAIRVPQAIAAGLIRLAIGLSLVAVGALVLLPTLPDPFNEFIPLEIFTFVAALICEVLIGNGVRGMLRKS